MNICVCLTAHCRAICLAWPRARMKGFMPSPIAGNSEELENVRVQLTPV